MRATASTWVIPSLPGYAFPQLRGGPRACTAGAWAALWAGLMTEVLGYRRFGAQGQDILARQERFRNLEGAYAHQQATYPLTLADGLTDSPAGLAAWIVEKFRTWSDCAGEVERRFTKDELLTVITIYWVTGTIGSSFLFDYDRQHELERRPPTRVGVPVGVALFPKENPVTGPREWADQAYNITRWTEMPRGGHFPAAEEPELLAKEIQEFFRPLR